MCFLCHTETLITFAKAKMLNVLGFFQATVIQIMSKSSIFKHAFVTEVFTFFHNNTEPFDFQVPVVLVGPGSRSRGAGVMEWLCSRLPDVARALT